MTILTWSCTEASINNEIFLNIMHAHTGTTVTLIYVTDRTPPPPSSMITLYLLMPYMECLKTGRKRLGLSNLLLELDYRLMSCRLP